MNFRFELQKNLETIRRAARLRDVSMNQFILAHAVRAAEQVIREAAAASVANPPGVESGMAS